MENKLRVKAKKRGRKNGANRILKTNVYQSHICRLTSCCVKIIEIRVDFMGR